MRGGEGGTSTYRAKKPLRHKEALTINGLPRHSATQTATHDPQMARSNASAKSHHFRRGSTFVYRRRVPEDVQHDPVFGGRSHLQRSLNTSHPTEAARAATRLTDWFDDEVRRVRAAASPVAAATVGPISRVNVLTSDDLEGIRARWWKSSVEEDMRSRMIALANPGGLDAEAVEARDNLAHQAIASFNDPVKGPKNRQDYIDVEIIPDIKIIVEGMCRRREIEIGSPDYYAMLHAVAEAEIEVLQTRFTRQEGSPIGDVGSDAIKRGLKQEERRPAASWSVTKLAASCIKARAKGASWNHKVNKAAEQFESFLGDGRTISAVRSVDVKEYVQLLLQCPERADLRFPKVDLRRAVELNGLRVDGPYPTIQPNTIRNTHLAALKWIFEHAHGDLEAISSNPAAKVKVAGSTKKGGTRVRFEIEELNALFRLPVFSGCAGPNSLSIAGSVKLDDHRFWAPLLLLYTGARPSEIAQLATTDVKLDGAHPYLSILTEFDPNDPDDRSWVRSMKTLNARRVLPIHPELVRLGFTSYARRMQDSRSQRLFPGWPLSKDERKLYSQASWIRAFNEKFIPSISSRKPRPTFYSFRHTFKSRLVAAGVPSQVQNQLLGHAQTGMDGSYFADGSSVPDLARQMSKIIHDGLDLEHLVRSQVISR